MSLNLSLRAYTSKNDKEYQKHFKAVVFCIENDLSFPVETSDFFKGKIEGDDLEDYKRDSILKYIDNGIEFELPTGTALYHSDSIRIYPKKIPESVDEIIVGIV